MASKVTRAMLERTHMTEVRRGDKRQLVQIAWDRGRAAVRLQSAVEAGRGYDDARQLTLAPCLGWYVKYWLSRWRSHCIRYGDYPEGFASNREMQLTLDSVLTDESVARRAVKSVWMQLEGKGSHWTLLPDGRTWGAPSAKRECLLARRAFMAAGGHAKVLVELRRRASAQESKEAIVVVGALRAAGKPASAVLEKMASSRGIVTVGVAVRRRMISDGEMDAGLRSDGRRRWAVDCVLEWRQEREMAPLVRWPWSSGRMALVRWLGFDKSTGDTWQDSWVRESWLTPDLHKRREASVLEEEDADRHVDKYQARDRVALGWRVSPRFQSGVGSGASVAESGSEVGTETV